MEIVIINFGGIEYGAQTRKRKRNDILDFILNSRDRFLDRGISKRRVIG